MKKLLIFLLFAISIQGFSQGYYIGSRYLWWDGRNLRFDSAHNGTYKYFASRDWTVDYVTQHTTAFSGSLVVNLSDGATITTDASLGYLLGSTYRVTLGGNRTIANPTSLTDGQRVVYELHQDATGSRTVTWDTMFTWSSDIPLPTLSTVANYTDLVGFVYNAGAGKLYVTGVNIGLH